MIIKRRYAVFNWLLATMLAATIALPPVSVRADITQPAEFYGDVAINAAPAPAGTVISARIGGNERGTITTTESGKYGGAGTFTPRLIVAGQQAEIGQPVSFYINGHKATETTVFTPGQSVQLALSAWVYPVAVSAAPVTKALAYLRQAQQPGGSIGGFVASSWAVMAIAAAGEDPHAWTAGGNSVVAYIRDNAGVNLEANKATDWERSVLAIVAAGESPRAFGGIDYIDKVLDFYTGGQIGDPALLNDDFWGILALVSVGEGGQIVPNSALYIKSQQNTDGGWGWAAGGASDADNTAAAVSALIAAGEPAGSETISKALNYLKTRQQTNGGFLSEGTTNAATDAWAMRAIRDAGQNPVDESWRKAGANSLGHLMSLQDADGAFKWTQSQRSNPEWMTAYVIPALLGKACPKDLIAPVLSGPAPSPGSGVTIANPTVSIAYSDAVSGINTGAVRIFLDGVNVTSGAAVAAASLNYPASGLGNGMHAVKVDIADKAGNPASLTWSFNVAVPDATGGSPPPAAVPTSTPLPPGITSLSGIINTSGVLLQGVVARSDDALCSLNLNQGTKAMQANGQAISQLTAVRMVSPPAPPASANIIGLPYDFGPAGATFEPAASLTFSYSPSQLPSGISPSTLTIAWWDAGGSRWVNLESTVDTEAGTITARVSHFTGFAVLGWPAAPAFNLSGLTISPAIVAINENVNVSVVVRNTGSAAGSIAVPLKVNNVPVETKNVTLAPGLSEKVIFNFSRDIPGTFTVSIGDLTSTFQVRTPGGLVLKSLTASPADIHAGETINIAVSVTNTGDTNTNQILTLKINSVDIESRGVALAPGVSDAITFTRKMDTPGTYTASVGTLTLIFMVKPAATLPATPESRSAVESAMSFVTSEPWLLWGAIAAGGLLVIIVLFALIRWIRRRNYYY